MGKFLKYAGIGYIVADAFQALRILGNVQRLDDSFDLITQRDNLESKSTIGLLSWAAKIYGLYVTDEQLGSHVDYTISMARKPSESN